MPYSSYPVMMTALVKNFKSAISQIQFDMASLKVIRHCLFTAKPPLILFPSPCVYDIYIVSMTLIFPTCDIYYNIIWIQNKQTEKKKVKRENIGSWELDSISTGQKTANYAHSFGKKNATLDSSNIEIYLSNKYISKNINLH